MTSILEDSGTVGEAARVALPCRSTNGSRGVETWGSRVRLIKVVDVERRQQLGTWDDITTIPTF